MHMTFYTDPVAKGRPRMTRSGHTYTPKKTKDAEDFLQVAMRYAPECPPEPFKRAVACSIAFMFPMPKSWSKKERGALYGRPHTQRPDLDNLVKTVCDAANEIIWDDDSQISTLTAFKTWGEEGMIDLRVEEI